MITLLDVMYSSLTRSIQCIQDGNSYRDVNPLSVTLGPVVGLGVGVI